MLDSLKTLSMRQGPLTQVGLNKPVLATPLNYTLDLEGGGFAAQPPRSVYSVTHRTIHLADKEQTGSEKQRKSILKCFENIVGEIHLCFSTKFLKISSYVTPMVAAPNISQHPFFQPSPRIMESTLENSHLSSPPI